MRSVTPHDLRGRCRRCLLPQALCLCGELRPVATRTEFVLLRHVRQAWKTSNTARLAPLALPRCALVDYGGAGAPFDDRVLAAPGTVLLFPDAAAPLAEPPRRVVVLDGSWSQARRMSQRLPALRTMPRLSLPPPAAGTSRLRRPPHPEGMSTLEAIAHVVAVLEGDAAAAPLFWLHDEHARRVRLSRGRRGVGRPRVSAMP
jgi:DTW domain-containing protein YfiP